MTDVVLAEVNRVLASAISRESGAGDLERAFAFFNLARVDATCTREPLQGVGSVAALVACCETAIWLQQWEEAERCVQRMYYCIYPLQELRIRAIFCEAAVSVHNYSVGNNGDELRFVVSSAVKKIVYAVQLALALEPHQQPRLIEACMQSIWNATHVLYKLGSYAEIVDVVGFAVVALGQLQAAVSAHTRITWLLRYATCLAGINRQMEALTFLSTAADLASQTEQPTLVRQINRMQAVLLRPSTSSHGAGIGNSTGGGVGSGGAGRQDGRRSVAQTPAIPGLLAISQPTLAAIHATHAFFSAPSDYEAAKSDLRTVTDDLLAARALQHTGGPLATNGGQTATTPGQNVKKGTQTGIGAGAASSAAGGGRNRAGGGASKRSAGSTSADAKGVPTGTTAGSSTSAAVLAIQREHEDETLMLLAMVLAIVGDLKYSGLALKALGNIKSPTVRILSEFTVALLKVQKSCTLLEMMSTTDAGALTLSNTNALKHAMQTVDHTMKIAGNIKDVRESHYITQMGCVLLWNLSLPLLQHGFQDFMYPMLNRACLKLSAMNSNLNHLYFVMELECSRMDADSGRLETALDRLHRIASIDYTGYQADPLQSSSATAVHVQVQWLLKRMNARRAGAPRPPSSLPADLALHIIEQAPLSTASSKKLLLTKALDLLKDATAIMAQLPTSTDIRLPTGASLHGRAAGGKAIPMQPAPPEGDVGDLNRRPRSLRLHEHSGNQGRQLQMLSSFGARSGGGIPSVANAAAPRRGQKGDTVPTPSYPSNVDRTHQWAVPSAAFGEQQWPLTPMRFVALLLDHLATTAWKSRHTDLMPVVRSAAELFTSDFVFKDIVDRSLIHKQIKAFFVLADTYVYEMGLRGLRIGMPLQSLGGATPHRRVKSRSGGALPPLEGETDRGRTITKTTRSDVSSHTDDDLTAVLLDYEDKVCALLVQAAQQSVTLLQMGVDDRWAAMNAGTALCNLYDEAFTAHGYYLRAIKPLGDVFALLRRVTPNLALPTDEHVMRDVAYAYVMALLQSYMVQCQLAENGGISNTTKSEQYLSKVNVFTFAPSSSATEPTPTRSTPLANNATQSTRNRNASPSAQVPLGGPVSGTAAQHAQLSRAAEVCQSMLALMPNAMSAKDFCLLSGCIARLLEGLQDRSASSIANGILGSCESRVDSHQYRLLQSIGQLEYLTCGKAFNAAKCTSTAEQAFVYLMRDPNVELCSRLALVLCRVSTLHHLVLQICSVGDDMYTEGQLGWKHKPEKPFEEPRKNGKAAQQPAYEATGRPHSRPVKRGGNAQHSDHEKLPVSPASKGHPRPTTEDNASTSPVAPHNQAAKALHGHRRDSEESSVSSRSSSRSSSNSDGNDDGGNRSDPKHNPRTRRVRGPQTNQAQQETPSSEDWFWYAKLLQCKATATMQRSDSAGSEALSHREVVLSALVTLVNSALAATRAPETHRLGVVIDAFGAYHALTRSFGSDAANRRQLLPSLRLMLSPLVFGVVQHHIDSSSNRAGSKGVGKGERDSSVDLHYAITITLDLWHLLISCLMDCGAYTDALKVVSQLLAQLPSKYHRSLLTVDVQCRCQLKEPLARALMRLREYDKLTQSAIWMKVAVYSTAPAEQRDAFVSAIGLLGPNNPAEYATAHFHYALWMLQHVGSFPDISLQDITQTLHAAIDAADVANVLKLHATKLSTTRTWLIVNVAVRSLLTLYRISSTLPHSVTSTKSAQKSDVSDESRTQLGATAAVSDEAVLAGSSMNPHLMSIVTYIKGFWTAFMKASHRLNVKSEQRSFAAEKEDAATSTDDTLELGEDTKQISTDKGTSSGLHRLGDGLDKDSRQSSLQIPPPCGEWINFLLTEDFKAFYTPPHAGTSALFESSTSACDARELVDSILEASHTIVHHSRAEHLAAPLLSLAKMLLASPVMSADPLFYGNSTVRCFTLLSETAVRCGLDCTAKSSVSSMVSAYLTQVSLMKPTNSSTGELIERAHAHPDFTEDSPSRRARVPGTGVVTDLANCSDWLIYPYWVDCARALLLAGQLHDAGEFVEAAQSLATLHDDVLSALRCGCLSASILLRVGQTARARMSLEVALQHDRNSAADHGGSLTPSADSFRFATDAEDIVELYYLQLESLLEEDREQDALDLMESLEEELDARGESEVREPSSTIPGATSCENIARAPHAYESVIVKLVTRFASAVAFHRKGRLGPAVSLAPFSGLGKGTLLSSKKQVQPNVSSAMAPSEEARGDARGALDGNERRVVALLNRASQRCMRSESFLMESHDELVYLYARLVCDATLRGWAANWSSAVLAPLTEHPNGALSDRLTLLTAEATVLRVRIAQLSDDIQGLFESSANGWKIGQCRPTICLQLGVALLLLGRNTRQRLSIRKEILRVYQEHPAHLMRIPEGYRGDLQQHVVAFMRAARRQQDAEAFRDVKVDQHTTLPQQAVQLLQNRLQDTVPLSTEEVKSVSSMNTAAQTDRKNDVGELVGRSLASESTREKSVRSADETGASNTNASPPQRSKMSTSSSLRSSSGTKGRIPSPASRSKKRDQRTHASSTRLERQGDGKSHDGGSENATQEEELQTSDAASSHTGGVVSWTGFSLSRRSDADGTVGGGHSSDEVRDALDVFHVPRDVAVETATLDVAQVMEVFFAAGDVVQGNSELCKMLYLEHASAALQKAIEHLADWEIQKAEEEKKAHPSSLKPLTLQKKWAVPIRLPEKRLEARQRSARTRGEANHERDRKPTSVSVSSGGASGGGVDLSSHDRPKRRNMAVPSSDEIERDVLFTFQLKAVNTSPLSCVVKLFDKAIDAAAHCIDYEALSTALTGYATCCVLVDGEEVACRALEQAIAARTCGQILQLWKNFAPRRSHERILYASLEHIQRHTPHLIDSPYFADLTARLLQSSPVFQTILPSEWMDTKRGSASIYDSTDGHRTGCFLGLDLCTASVSFPGDEDYAYVVIRRPDGVAHARRVPLARGVLDDCMAQWHRFCDARAAHLSENSDSGRSKAAAVVTTQATAESTTQHPLKPVGGDDAADRYRKVMGCIEDAVRCLWVDFLPLLSILSGEQSGKTCRLVLCLDPLLQPLPFERLHVFSHFRSIHREVSVPHLLKKLRQLNGEKLYLTSRVSAFVDVYHECPDSPQCIRAASERIKSVMLQLVCPVVDGNDMVCLPDVQSATRKIGSAPSQDSSGFNVPPAVNGTYDLASTMAAGLTPNAANSTSAVQVKSGGVPVTSASVSLPDVLLTSLCGALPNSMSLSAVSGLYLSRVRCAAIFDRGMNPSASRRENKQDIRKNQFLLWMQQPYQAALLLLARGVSMVMINLYAVDPHHNDELSILFLQALGGGPGNATSAPGGAAAGVCRSIPDFVDRTHVQACEPGTTHVGEPQQTKAGSSTQAPADRELSHLNACALSIWGLSAEFCKAPKPM